MIAAARTGPTGGDVPPGPGGTDDWPVGREHEAARLEGCLSDPDGPCLILVRGERGVGRTSFLQTAARRQHAAGTTALSLDCVPGDDRSPYLLALRLVRELEQRRLETGARRRPGDPVTDMLAAAEHSDGTAAAAVLAETLALTPAAVVVVDDVHHADLESVRLLAALAGERTASGTRLVVSLPWHGGAEGRAPTRTRADTRALLGRHPAAHTVALAPLEPAGTAVVLAQRVQATPDVALTGLVHRMSRGVPAAVHTLLDELTRCGAIRVSDGHAFLDKGLGLPVMPRGDRYTEALDMLGEPAVTVASALSVLWPLGVNAAPLTAEVTGLPPKQVRAGLRALLKAGIVDELPTHADGAARGWTFRIPLTEYSVRRRSGPLSRARLAAAAVQALWSAEAEPNGGTRGAAGFRIVAEANAATYLPDQIVEAGKLIDPERAVAELVAAAERMGGAPEDSCVLPWLRAAAHLTDEPRARGRLLLTWALHGVKTGDRGAVRAAVGELLESAGGVFGPAEETLQAAVVLLVGATFAAGEQQELSQMAEARWWDGQRLPPAVGALGRALALCALDRRQAAEELLARSERHWSGDGPARVLPEVYRGGIELVRGRTERFRRTLTLPETAGLSEQARHMVTVVQTRWLLEWGDLRGAGDLLAERRLTIQDMPVHVRFLWRRLEGRWDEAMALHRRMMANHLSVASGLDYHLPAERATAILLARGRIKAAVRMIDEIREGLGEAAEHEYILRRAEAEAARVLGDRAGAERALRRGLGAARDAGEVYATDELWAALAALHIEAGNLSGAKECVRRLERVAEQTENGRSRLLWLLASARLPAADDPDGARKQLLEAVGLARHRGQPFETAMTLLAAARQGEDPAASLSEAYELFGQVGALLWRFHVRADLRAASLTVPRRDRATAENDYLLATLVSEGLRNRQIAAVLGLSPDAVANRLTRLFAHTGARSRTEVVTAVLSGSTLAADW